LALNLEHLRVEQTAPVGPQVYRSLRERIVKAELEPGALLSEAEVARDYAISRQPVREAFIKLADEGLLEIRPQRGTLVRKINTVSVMDARFVREAVEADIVRIVAREGDADVIGSLREQVQTQQEALNRGQENFMSMDDAFHRTLALAAGKAHVWSVVNGVKAQMDRVRYLTLLDETVIQRAIDDHMRIVDALESGDVTATDEAMRFHLRQILLDLPGIARLKPDYFENIDFKSNVA